MILSFVTNTCHIGKNCCYFMSVMFVLYLFLVLSRKKNYLFKKLITFVKIINFHNFSSKFTFFEKIAKVYLNWKSDNKLLSCVNFVNRWNRKNQFHNLREFYIRVQCDCEWLSLRWILKFQNFNFNYSIE